MSGMDGMGMGGMDMGSSSNSSTMMMMAVFSTERDTPLYSTAWTPTTTGAYAATCIFLIALGALFRALLAAKAWQESRWLDAELRRRYVVVQGKLPVADRLSHDSTAKELALVSEQGVEERVVVVQKKGARHTSRPWRLSVDPLRAAIDMVIAGVGYLLMLAVMTMNVGYFLSVLAGTFVGSLAVGRFVTSGEH